MAVAMTMKLILKLITYGACIFGLCFQLSYISSRYFKYNSKTTLVVDLKANINFPALTTCFMFNDIINLEDIRKDIGLDLKRWTDVNYSSIEFNRKTSRFTVSDWFKYTPAINKVFADDIGCRIRFPGTYAAKPYNSSTCSKFFKISKNIFTDVMCYSFEPINTETLNNREYQCSPSYKDLIYSIKFEMSRFGTLSEVKHVIHYDSSFAIDFFFSKTKPIFQKAYIR